MKWLIEWLRQNKQWVFSGIGVWILGGFFGLLVLCLGFVFRSNIGSYLNPIWGNLISHILIPRWLLYLPILLLVGSVIPHVLKLAKAKQVVKLQLADIHVKILEAFGQIGEKRVYPKTLAQRFQMSEVKMVHYLNTLKKSDFLYISRNYVDGNSYGLAERGREYLVKNDLI